MQLSTVINLLNEWRQHLSSKKVQKHNDIWVFGAIRGRRYFDNAKYLFEYVNIHTKVRAVWISKEDSVVQTVRDKGFEAYLEESPEARHFVERAAVAVITHRGNRHNADLPFHWLSKKTFLVQLWHGIPLKKIAFDDTHFSFTHDESSLGWKVKSVLKNWFFPFRQFVNHPDLIPASSEETRKLYSSAFRTPIENVVITGYPRNDRLFENRDSAIISKKKVVYMPTFRGRENSDFDLFGQYGFDAQSMDSFLSDHQLKLDIKLHPFNYPSNSLLDYIDRSTNIELLECDDVYEVLSNYQILITDYSSIYFDYLLLDRPVIFAPFDKSDYIGQERDFYFSYEDVTPGPKANTWSDVMSMISQYMSSPDWFSKERAEISNRFLAVKDGNSSERVYRAIARRSRCLDHA